VDNCSGIKRRERLNSQKQRNTRAATAIHLCANPPLICLGREAIHPPFFFAATAEIRKTTCSRCHYARIIIYKKKKKQPPRSFIYVTRLAKKSWERKLYIHIFNGFFKIISKGGRKLFGFCFNALKIQECTNHDMYLK